MPREFVVIRDGMIVGIFDTAKAAETAMKNLTVPKPPGTLKVIEIGPAPRDKGEVSKTGIPSR
jgi:hypothetical protein